jgi:arylsulfatase A-like enzyme/Flp pilus assembly protein TadD
MRRVNALPRQLAALLATAACCGTFAGATGCRRGAGDLPAAFPGAPVVLISIDTLRSDHLPFYGYGKVETPALTALRADSILFERAYTHVPLTLPAHVSILTGLLPDGHGVHDNLGYSVDPKVPTLAELLRKAGYATGGAVSSVVLNGASGVGRGFDLWDDDVVPTRANQALNRVQRPGDETEAALAAWLEGKKAPFFALLHLYEPHSPYEPKEPFRSRFADPYDGEIATADAVVGKFLDRLRAKGLYDQALVVFLSDHGEGLGEHGEDEHGVFLYREVLQVPLLVKLPGGAGRGTSVAAPVQLVDVFTTIATAAGVAGFVPPAGTVSLLDTAAGRATEERRVFAESFFPRIHFGWSELRSLLDGRWHYVEGPKAEFYDLASDPAERTNLLESKPPAFRTMRIEMEKLRTTFRPPGAVDPEAAKQLASLGYLSSGATAGDGPLDDPKDHIATVRAMKEALADFMEGRPAKAVEATGRLLDGNPRMLDIWELRALALAQLGRMDESLAALKKTVELAPAGSTHYLRLVANHCLEMGKTDEAVRHAELARKMGDPAADEVLARAFLARGDLKGAEAAAQTSLKAPVNRNRGILVLARIAAKRGDLPGALALTAKAVGAAGSLPPAGLHLLRGDLLARMSRHAEAETEFREEVRAYPATYPAWESLVLLLAAQGRAADARAVAAEMVGSVPGVETYLSAVRALSVIGDAAGAAHWQQEGLARFPEEPRLRRLPRAA